MRLALGSALALATLLAPTSPAKGASSQEDADQCAKLQTAVTLDKLQVDGRQIDAAGTWTAAAGTPGVMLEVRSDGDVWGSYTELGAAGPWTWSGPAPTSSRMCGHHALRVYAHALLKRGQELVHCFAVGVSAKQDYFIDCSSKATIAKCSWTCAPGGDGACDGTCTGTARGLGATFVPFWQVGDTKVPPPPDASPGPWEQTIHCQRGQKISLVVHGYSGSGAGSTPVSVMCGEQP